MTNPVRTRTIAAICALSFGLPALAQVVPPYAYRIPLAGINAAEPQQPGIPLQIGNSGGGHTGTVGQPMSVPAPSVSGGQAPYSLALSGPIPPGLTASGGSLSGTPTTAGSWSLSLTVTDSAGTTATAPVQISVNPAASQPIALSLSANPPSEAMAGQSFSATLSASGGVAPYAFASSGSLPGGLSVSGSTFGGTFSTAGSFNYSLTATDGQPVDDTRAFSTTVYGAFQAHLSAAPQATAVTGTDIAPVSVLASGGKPPYAYGRTGTLPPGLTLDPASGELSGRPTTPGTYTFALNATQSLPGVPAQTSGDYTMVVSVAPLEVSGSGIAPEYAIGKTLSPRPSIEATGGTAPYTYTASGLPAGMQIAADGTTTGAPSAPGTHSFTLTAADSGSPQRTGTRSFTVTAYPALTVSVTKPAYLTSGTPVAGLSVATTGGKGTARTFTVTGGALPPGIQMLADGSFTGSATGSGTATFRVRVQDELGTTEDSAVQTIGYAPPVTISATLPNATQNQYYDQTFFTGGRGPHTVTLNSGTVPAGLQRDGSRIYGYPSAGGTTPLSYTVTDADGRTDTKTVTIVVDSSAPAAGRSLISSASYGQVAASGAGGFLYYTPPYTNAQSFATTNAAKMLEFAKDPIVYQPSSTGTVLYASIGNAGTLRFTLTYAFSQDVVASSLDQRLGFGEGSGCTNQNVIALYEGSLNGTSWSTLYSTTAVKGNATSLGVGYGGTYYEMNQSFAPTTVRYVRAT